MLSPEPPVSLDPPDLVTPPEVPAVPIDSTPPEVVAPTDSLAPAPLDGSGPSLDPLTGLGSDPVLIDSGDSDSLAPKPQATAGSVNISFDNADLDDFIQDFLNLLDRATPLSPVSIRLEFGTSTPSSDSREETTGLGSASLDFTISGNGLAEKTFGIRLPTILG
ncbi:MAG: hypothetical protein HC771_04970 [Synechococcales cyanobacterium CRU_2_2]|nr:hypothetical protein [Synechococcales cyanobacterium CRU_2_2]